MVNGNLINIGKNKIHKNILLYGNTNVGKTLFQYQLQSNMKLDQKKLKETYGISYEVFVAEDVDLGIFDISGDLQQYKIANVITKNIEIHGIIYVFSLDQLDKIEEAKQALERIIGNNYLENNLCLFILYNKKNEEERLDWIDSDLLDNKLGVPKLKKKYKLKGTVSQIFDISKVRNDGIEGLFKFKEILK